MIERLMMLFVLVFGVMVVLLLLRKPIDDFHVLYQKQSYSMMKSSRNETFEVQMLASSKESFYLDDAYIVHTTIYNKKTDEQVSVDIEDIVVKEEEVVLKEPYYLVSFVLRMSFDVDSYEIMYPEAMMTLLYENEEVLMIDLGEFYYIEEQASAYVNVLELVATHDVYHGLTVSGLYIEFGHNLPGDIEITSVDLGSDVASINPLYSREMEVAVSYDDKLTNILQLEEYDYLRDDMVELNLMLRRHQTKGMYFPLTYHSEEMLLHRFYIKISYLFEGEKRVEVIDDFPFIRQNVVRYSEGDFDVYYPRVYSEQFRETVQKS